MKREKLEYFAIEYFIYWDRTLPKFSLEIINVPRYDYLPVPEIVIYYSNLHVAAF